MWWWFGLYFQLLHWEERESHLHMPLAQSVREFGRRWLDYPTKALLCTRNISGYCCKRECILNSVFKDKSFQVECIELMTQTHLDFNCWFEIFTVKADVWLTVIINVNDHIRNPICSLVESSKAYLATLDCALGLKIFACTPNVSHHSFFRYRRLL